MRSRTVVVVTIVVMGGVSRRVVCNGVSFADFFLQSTDGPEYSRTNCYQMHTNDKHCVGYFWNFGNASARDYFVEHLIMPLALSPAIDGVFFDAFNFAYNIPEVKPWGRPVVNIPNCSTMPRGGAAPGWGGCEALLNGTLDVATRTTALLNAHGKVPMFANPGSFIKPAKQHIWMDEARIVKVQGLHACVCVGYPLSHSSQPTSLASSNTTAQHNSCSLAAGRCIASPIPPAMCRRLMVCSGQHTTKASEETQHGATQLAS